MQSTVLPVHGDTPALFTGKIEPPKFPQSRRGGFLRDAFVRDIADDHGGFSARLLERHCVHNWLAALPADNNTRSQRRESDCSGLTDALSCSCDDGYAIGEELRMHE